MVLNELNDSTYKGKPERVIRFHVEAWDVNGPEHIKPRFDEEDVEEIIQKLKNRVAELEAENDALTNKILAETI